MTELIEANFWIIAASLFALLIIEAAALSYITYKRGRRKGWAAVIAAAPLPLLGLLFFKPLFLAATAVGGVAALGGIIAGALKHAENKDQRSNWIEEVGQREREKYRKKLPEPWSVRMARLNE